MTSLSSYTPVESLLLFQALQAHGVTSIPFSTISGQLQRIPLVRNDPTYDSARLEPAALKRLYLGLLEEEALRDVEVERGDSSIREGQDGFVSPRSRKRRAPSPSLPTVEEAAKHSHLIPKLIHRLYSRYREKTVEEIRRYERNYDAATRDIHDIENGQWDEKLGEEQTKKNQEVADLQPSSQEPQQQQQQQQQQPEQDQEQNQEQSSGAPTISALPDQDRARPSPVGTPKAQSIHVAEDKEPPSVRPNHAKIDAVINHEPVATRSSPSANASPHPPDVPAKTALPPLSEMAPESPGPSPGPSSAPSRGSYRASPQQVHTPQMQSPMHAGPGYRNSPPIGGHQPPYPVQYPLGGAQGPAASPQLQTTLARASPSSPRLVLPLPPGMKVQPQSPIMQNGSSNHRPPPPIQPHPSHRYASPTQRLPPVSAKAADNRGTPRALPAHLPAPSGYPQPYPQYQGGPHQYPASAPQSALHQSYSRPPSHGPPHQGGVQLPPFQVGPPDPHRSAPPPQHMAQNTPVQQRRPVPAHPPQHSFPPYSPYGQNPPRNQQDQVRLTNSIVEALKQAPWPTWKAARPAHLPHPLVSDESPSVERLSPIPERIASPSPKRHLKAPAKETEPPSRDGMLAPTDQRSVLAPAKSPGKPTRMSTRQSRASSATSSVVATSVRARTRSQSVVSHAESQPAQSEASASGRQVKDEPTTPAEFPHLDVPAAAAAPVETPPRTRDTRQRRSNVQVQVQSTSKRKRQPSPSPAVEEAEAVPTYLAPRNEVVAASRNFQRLSSVIMNDISTHRHAGPFQKPVREKDAEGYLDIIKRPQDLKSIKAAITAGTRAIGAAAAARDFSTDSPSATPSAVSSKEGGTIVLEKTADLVPPRAIVNSSQLEKEVMRMFANAVMFNPGEGGMVQDAREMAEDIEAKVRDWRSAERQVEGRDEEEDSAVTSAGPGKRRKL